MFCGRYVCGHTLLIMFCEQHVCGHTLHIMFFGRGHTLQSPGGDMLVVTGCMGGGSGREDYSCHRHG
jgi:hypothetical protein